MTLFLDDQYKNKEGGFPVVATVVYPKNNSDLKLWIENSPEYFNPVTELKSVTIAGLNGYSFVSDGMVTSTYYAFANKSNTYAYVLSNNSLSDKDFKTMINTFGFTN